MTPPDVGALVRLPDVPRFDDPALCAETDPELFFPGRGEPTRDAKSICRRCDALAECLEFAVSFPEPLAGVWGGTSERERRRIRTQRERVQRRRKPIPHGTDAGYRAHSRQGVPMCDECRAAHAVARKSQESAA